MTKVTHSLTVVHVLGTGHSGSTVLDLMLGSGPDTFSAGEVHAWFWPTRQHHFRIRCSCGRNPCPVWRQLSSVSARSFHAEVARMLGVNAVIDSSKNLRWVLMSHTWARVSGLRVRNVAIWKSPEALAFSLWKRGINHRRWRRMFVSYFSRLRQLGLPLIAVRQEVLARSPAEVLGRLCSTVGIPYFPGKERFWEYEHHHVFGSLRVRRQVEGKHPVGAATSEFPPDFTQIARDVRAWAARDERVRRLVEWLSERDVLGCATVVADATEAKLPLLKPLWFYREAARATLRRYLPARWPHEE